MDSIGSSQRRQVRTGSKSAHHSGLIPSSRLHPETSRHTAAGTVAICVALNLAFSVGATAGGGQLTPEDRVELIRGLSSEYATVKDFLPRSKRPLVVEADGSYNKQQWAQVGQTGGPAARVGDLVQITRVTIEHESILIEINGGTRSKGKWTDHVQVGMGGPRTQQQTMGDSNAVTGTNLQIDFHHPLTAMKAQDVKTILAPLLDFEKRSATELYSASLSPEVQKAIKEKRAENGMDRDQVVLALGRPERKVRETVEGAEREDWIFGVPPGRILFVTFENSKVIKVKETYAGLGAEAAAPLATPH